MPAPPERKLDSTIDAGRRLRLRSVLPGKALTEAMRYALERLLARHSREDLYECLHACLVEILGNATRANMKYLYMREAGVDPADVERYRGALRDFKAERKERGWHRRYRRLARDAGLYVEVRFEQTAGGLRIFAENNLPLRPEDEARVRQRFAGAMVVSDLVEFYMSHADDSEGEGLGVALATLYLRAEGLDPALFRFGQSSGATFARIEIPLREDFVSLRGRGPGARES